MDASFQTTLRERSRAHKTEVELIRESFDLMKDAAVIFEADNNEEMV